ncbi:DUF502 domain-containing protein [Haloarcula laminariae]|uniref:DUF502 domain-containing protein n=1 Tax=Haloarcula laminariae TaxID=2961577 RepID=UPI002405A34C|nr:DUF502 domain-containing protein [Halomicroarcula sp. FL173]
MADTRETDHIPTPSVRATARQALVTGFALTIPLFVTLLVIGFVVNALSNVLDPLVTFAFQLSGSRLVASETPAALVKLVAVVVLFVSVLCIGFVAERRPGTGRIESVFDATMERIPGVGSIYTSFDEMSKMLLDSDTQSFQEVVLVEHPTPDSYTVAFVTASTPETIERATGNDEMVTLFMPMAPNPVMGGHVVHVPTSKVYDVDMTVEEGLRSIVTSGVAVGETDEHAVLGTDARGTEFSYPPQSQYHPDAGTRPTPPTAGRDREAAYSDDIDAQHADTPAAVARRGDGDTVGSETSTPEDIEPAEEEQG